MVHTEVLKKFMGVYPITMEEIKCWFPNGKNSVRVRFKDNSDMIFTYTSKKVWKIESVESWLDGLRMEASKLKKAEVE